MSKQFLGMTESTCPVCRNIVPTKLLGIAGDLYFDKFCPVHGQSTVFVRADVDDYLKTLHYVKPATKPFIAHGRDDLPCPTGCGFCDRHEQHLCLPIVEITDGCDMGCPICLVDAQGSSQLSVSEFSFILDELLKAEPQIDILNLSGGEPLTHPELLAIIDNALQRPQIVRVSISTNGLRLLTDHHLVKSLKERNVVVSLQFDGVNDKIYQTLRGRPLLREKRAILDTLSANDITTSLTMTAARSVNDDQLGDLLELLFTNRNIVSMMIQPLAYEGRGCQVDKPQRRLTTPDILQMLDTTGKVAHSDFVPLPCSHPACFTLAFYLMLDTGGYVSLGKLFAAGKFLDTVANKAIFGLDEREHEELKNLIYDLWSGPAATDPASAGVLKTVRNILREIGKSACACFDPRTAFQVSERKIKSIFIHSFQDVDTFDLARIRRCCNGYPQKDGTVIPACVNNVIRRHR